jgi:hypothetical protein
MLWHGRGKVVAGHRNRFVFPKITRRQGPSAKIRAEMKTVPTETDFGWLIASIEEPHSNSVSLQRPHQYFALAID